MLTLLLMFPAQIASGSSSTYLHTHCPGLCRGVLPVSPVLLPLTPALLFDRFRPDGFVQCEGDPGEQREWNAELLCPDGILPCGAEDRVSAPSSSQTCHGRLAKGGREARPPRLHTEP